MIRIALTIAGSDSGGGAGIQADLKTFAAFGVFGTTVITALTAQNTQGVRAVADVSPAFVRSQLDAIREDFPVAAAKTGMLARRAVIETVAAYLLERRLRNLVVDPVIVAASGDILLATDAISALRELMLPLATLVTPNVREAEMLTDTEINDLPGMRRTARALLDLGPQAVLIKGGRLGGATSIDVLLRKNGEPREFSAPRVSIDRPHGTGCTLSAAIAAALALGIQLDEAVELAKDYVTRALVAAEKVGHGATPLNHLVKPKLGRLTN
jgi:hydroxymethylpyrimidine/phosphomethylpyrimidine kinase